MTIDRNLSAANTQKRVRPMRVATASFIGTAIEWYDYFIYGMAAALAFGPLFFPSVSPAAGTLAAFATYSVGFAARPIGGIIMGHFGDRVGRKSMLVISLLTMGIATVGIGLLPTYETVGVWAPVLLVTLRFIQGLGVGGEWGGAVLMAVEHAPDRKKAFYGSFPQMGVPGGLIIANLAFLSLTNSLSNEAFLAWGWRIPFLASAVMVVAGLVIRLTISESPEFQAVKKSDSEQRMPLVTVLRESWKEVLLSAGAFIGINAVGYIFMAYLLSYTTAVLGLSRNLILTFTLIASLVWLAVIPWASALSDRHGRRKILTVGSVGLVVSTILLFPMINTADSALILISLLITAVFMGIVYGPIAALFSELFKAEVRYSGASLGYQLGSILGGGIAPTVATGLYTSWGSTVPISLYLTGVTLISLGCVWVVTRRTG
ncbi:MFS transporter [Streptomyces sp. NBC_00878]|uniref:MFS transporter n=1 Tax=Streptomyces sp. NBC_00878 TaxID=2975854 RepID=UPI00225BD6A7|nr:MFS transporter [Streptomyces sp. NBC_00878]MCX4911205.1 MHS family MFS transporter [Streptomyces sp. NBC_00878]